MKKISRAKSRGKPVAGIAATAVFFLVFCAAGGSTGFAQAEAGLPEGTFAVIDGETVPRAEFEAYFARYARSTLYHGGSEARYLELRTEATERFIVDRLLLREAARRGIDGDPEDVERQVRELEARYEGSETWATVREQLPKIRQALLDKIKMATLLAEVERVADPDEVRLRAFYDANIELFTIPARNHLSLMLIGVAPSAASAEWQAAEAKATELFADLDEGADFAALAREHSTHETASEGGGMGLVHKGELSTAVQEALGAIEPGQVTPPIRVLEGYVLFKLLGRLPPEVSTFEKVRDRALALYKRRLSREQRDRFVSDLKDKAVVTIGELVNATEEARDSPAQ
jgi:hypothetical protein